MQTVDLNKLRLQPGAWLVDIGCGEGRHALAASLHEGVHVLALDINREDIQRGRAKAQEFLGVQAEQPQWLQASALQLPLADASVDHIICSEVLEHLADHRPALLELRRVLKPGGTLCVSVPRAWPERICWALEPAYQDTPGGHVRILAETQLAQALSDRGLLPFDRHGAHALHAPYWWLKCLLWRQPQHWLLAIYHRLLVWHMLSAPVGVRALERLLNPWLGKSIVLYCRREQPE
jgi:SAM-dependent methyltransferase